MNRERVVAQPVADDEFTQLIVLTRTVLKLKAERILI